MQTTEEKDVNSIVEETNENKRDEDNFESKRIDKDDDRNEGGYHAITEISSEKFAYTRTFPKRIFKNGDFIDESSSSSSSKQILYEPSKDSAESPFKNLWKLICEFFTASTIVSNRSSLESNHNSSNDNGLNLIQDTASSTHIPTACNNDEQYTSVEDVEAQHPKSITHKEEDQEDGIYVPVRDNIDSSTKYLYRDRILSRLERDNLLNDEERSEEQYNDLDHPNAFIFRRPQDAFPKENDDDQWDEKQSVFLDNNAGNDDNAISIKNDTTSMTLIVHIFQAKVHHHPMSIEEERLVQQMEKLYNEQKSFNDLEKMRNFEVRLHAIISAILNLHDIQSRCESKVSDSTTVDESQYELLYEDFLHMVSKIVKLEYKVFSLYCSILKLLDKVIRVRQLQGFQSTTYTLVKVANSSNDDSSGDHSSNQMKRFQQHFDRYMTTVVTHDDNKLQNIQDAIETYFVAQSSRKSRLNIALQKGNERMITNTSNIAIERKRRKNIRSECYQAKLFVDEEFVGSTSKVQLEWPSMQLTFDKSFELAIHDKNPKVCLHFFKVKLGLLDEFISKVYVNVPGYSNLDKDSEYLDFYSPMEEWYQFSKITNISGSDDKNRRMEGTLFVRTFWRRVKDVSKLSNRCSGQQVMKPDLKSLYSRQNLIGMDHRMYPTRIKRNLPLHLKPSVQAALNDAALRFTHEGTRHFYHNSRVLKEPVRHKLMKQRQNNKFLSNDFSIPLEEKSITVDDIRRVANSKQLSKKSNVSNTRYVIFLLVCFSTFENGN